MCVWVCVCVCFGPSWWRNQIPTLVTVQASPSLLAVALPRLLACPVEAAGVSGALVAALALPALPAHTLPGRLAEAVLLAAPRCTDGWWEERRGNAGEGGQSKKEREREKGGRKPERMLLRGHVCLMFFVRITKQPPLGASHTPSRAC